MASPMEYHRNSAKSNDCYTNQICQNGLTPCQKVGVNGDGQFQVSLEKPVKMKKFEQDVNSACYTRTNGEHEKNGFATDSEDLVNGSIPNGKQVQSRPVTNGKYAVNGSVTNGVLENSKNFPQDNAAYSNHNGFSSAQVSRIPDEVRASKSNPVVVTDRITASDLHDLFSDKICVLHIPNYVSRAVCDKLDSFLREKGSDQYTHEIRKDGRADLLYFGVNRYGLPLNSTYNDETDASLKKYLSEALPTIRSIRKAAEPFLSPIDKLRVEMDEVWPNNVNIATLNGQKTFCGIGRIMPASLSELSADQPHFDAIPVSYFPDIHKQFAANIYLNVPEEGGELEIWDVTPVDVDNVNKFEIPENWRSKLPESIKVKPGHGDLLLLNTRRPHAITKFSGSWPRTSIQTFIGLTKDSDVFFWV